MKIFLTALLAAIISTPLLFAETTPVVKSTQPVAKAVAPVVKSTKTVEASTAPVKNPLIPTEKIVVLELEYPVMENPFTGEMFKPTGLCSGFFIGSKGQIMTAAHCVNDRVMSVTVKPSDGSKYTAEVLYISDKSDLALLKISTTTQYDYFTVAPSVSQGEAVYTLGHPLRNEYTLTHGIVAKLEEEKDKKTLVDMTVLPGNSGGPVYNSKGELLGVASAGYIVMFGTTGLNLVVSLPQILEFLDLFRGL